ncbi:MAG: lipoate--protein ligase family protein [Candidatus Omnitrophica bacterium]|nr:lipoate--protein ligase family protein [Candidatus Omnitrophota bacterium]
MILKDVTFSSPKHNLLYDDVLLHQAENENQQEVARIWESRKLFIVLGRISKASEDVFLENAYHDQVPVLRRSSGGGTVLQGKGCLNYSLILDKERHKALNDIQGSYKHILSLMIEVFKRLNITAEYFPVSDIAIRENQKKFSGNAQKRGRRFILHHGTVLYDFKLDLIPRYLKLPKSIPQYRQQRSHENFVTNIPIQRDDFISAFKETFSLKERSKEVTLEEEKLLNTLLSKEDRPVL